MARLFFIVLLIVLIALFFIFDLGQYLTLDYLKSQQAAIAEYYAANPTQVMLIYFAIYVTAITLSLPGAAILTLAGGAIFGLLWGTVLVSFASTIGATLAFLVARFLLKDIVQRRFGNRLQAVNEGVEKDGAFYLFTLRLVPIFPFFIINLLMALTPIRTIVFALVSQVGMLPATLVYVNAGQQLAEIESLGDILSFNLIFAFALLGIFPLIAKKIVDFIKSRQVMKKYPKPKKFDTNMVVIGAGSAGLIAALIAATVKAKVTLIERHKMGGDCLNTGCVPSKALIRSAKFLSHIRRSKEFGFHTANADFDFADVMERVQGVIKAIEPNDSVERYTSLGVDCETGDAKILSPYSVEVNGKTITTKNIVIAAGARPFVPPVPGIEDMDYYTSDTIWDLRELPKRMVVLGGGPIGCELSQSFARFGCQISQIEMLPNLLSREDDEISDYVLQRFLQEGIDVRLNHKATQFLTENGQKVLLCEHNGETVRIEFDALLVAVGRIANTEGYGLEELGIGLNPQRTIEHDDFMRTIYPNIFVCGDVAGPYQFTHTASHQAWFASINALFGWLRKFRADYSIIPAATFTDPEVARVGLNEKEAKAQGIDYEVTTFDFEESDRALADQEAHGVIKVLTPPGKDKVLGATIVGEHAGDLLAEYVMAMKYNIGLKKIAGVIHTYPTLSEINKSVTGRWRQKHKPEGLLGWVAKYHAWMRGAPLSEASGSPPSAPIDKQTI
ncbi:MAG: FAD-dependent oxidoreductase [Pseudomonadota bacterium]